MLAAAAALMLFYALPQLVLWGEEDDVKPLRYLWHSIRGRCAPIKVPGMSAFRCDCGRTGRSLDEFPGFEGQGYVGPDRVTFEREHGAITREPWQGGRR